MVVAEREQLEPADRAAWRQWLAAHHDESPGVWLVLYRKAAGPQQLTPLIIVLVLLSAASRA